MGFFSRAKPVTDAKKIDELLTRGVENVIPRDLAKKKLASGERIRVYLGIDPTGAQLHLGHSVPLRKLKAFADLGHEVIFVVGGFTAMIGDPSGRDTLRPALTREQVKENFRTYKRQAEKILDFSSVTIRYNDEWLAPLTLNDIVKLASNFTVQQMLQRDMFEKRIKDGKPIALHEFLYPLMVGYDSAVLDVDAELGGSDQEFNMLAGRQLQSALKKRDKFVLTTKLIEGTDGRKMSKTYGNCIYLEDAPADMYGKVMSVRDELMPVYFETCTDIPMDEVQKLLASHPRDAKQRLAKEIVTMYHGADAAQAAAAGFMTADAATELHMRDGATLRDIANDIGVSMSELRRLVEQKAIDLN
ncbi:MAG: tyrosine--tRNA ligase, partial [Patescibacteria group bacterium]